jgi:hypothetical protein
MVLTFPGRLPVKRGLRKGDLCNRARIHKNRGEQCGQQAQNKNQHLEISQRKTRRMTGGLVDG